MKIRSVGAALLHVEMDVTKLMFAFRNFAKAPKNRLCKGCIFFKDPLPYVIRDPYITCMTLA